MEAGGIEPPTPACKAGVFPLAPRPQDHAEGSAGAPRRGVNSGASTRGSTMRQLARLATAGMVIGTLAVFAMSAQAAAPTWSSVKVQKISPGVPWTEPRITTGPDGTLWLVTNGEKFSETAGGGEENTAPA